MDLDREIAEARRARARLQALADDGDQVAKLAVKRLADAERQMKAIMADAIFGSANHERA